MAKYRDAVSSNLIGAGLYAIAALISIVAVTWVTYDKFNDLRVAKMNEPYQFVSLKDRERQLKCMADNIYYEAAMEPAEGKIAVAQIVMNRVAHPKYPKDPCEVIYQKNTFTNTVVCQFTWLCDGSVGRRPIRQDLWNESYRAAQMVMLEGFRLPSLDHALFYHADYVNPQWKKPVAAKIGRHIFYKPREI